MTVTVFLLWSLVAGKPYDVDSFMSREACDKAYLQATNILDDAKKAKPDLDYTLVPCISAEVALPGLAGPK